MKILVTGGAGFIGSHIVEHYQDKAEEIRVLDNLRTGYLKNLDGLRHTFIEGSICDRELVRQAVQGVDYIFHKMCIRDRYHTICYQGRPCKMRGLQ